MNAYQAIKLTVRALCISLTLLSSSVANAETIRWVTESWQNYTNKDGSGLYNDIVKAVFAEHKLEIINMPWKRSLLEVKNGTADMTGATSFVDGYIIPRHAILATPISILFDKKKMSYTDLHSLKNHVAVWASPYEDELLLKSHLAFIKGFSVLDRKTAYKLLVSGRADYFVDAKALHQAWLQSLEQDAKALHQAWLQSLEQDAKATIKAVEYQLADIHHLNLFMIFSDNARGQRLKDIFDKGMASLIEKDQLRPIYEKYHFLEQMPAPPPQ
jgi:ABC-type amino acid transport substrate-binding protein